MKPHEDEPLDTSHSELDRLRDEIHQLERRVDALEHSNGHSSQPAALTAIGPVDGGPDFALPNVIPVAGRAILGMAGAYLLRALAESGAVSPLLVVAGAILYAATWLVFSVRTRHEDALARATYGITAALILVPLLWEATVRFNVLPPTATAAILIAFMVLGSAMAWRRNPEAVTVVITLSTVLTAVALMVRTGDLVPFAAALLGVACMFEAGACVVAASAWREHGNRMRGPVAIAADFAIWFLLFIMTRAGGVPEAYKPVAPATSLALCGLLFLIYEAGMVWRTVVLRRAISAFEIGQSAVAVTLAIVGALEITQGRAAAFVGSLSAIACAACYFTAFIRFADSPRRNHHFFASWGAVLGLVACFLILPESLLTPIWSPPP